jgi:hypothetical protein
MKLKVTASFLLLLSVLLSGARTFAASCPTLLDLSTLLVHVRNGGTRAPGVLHPDLVEIQQHYVSLRATYGPNNQVLEAKDVYLKSVRRRIGEVLTMLRALDAQVPEKVALWDIHRRELQKYLPGWGSAQFALEGGQFIFLGIGSKNDKTHALLFGADGRMWRGEISMHLASDIRHTVLTVLSSDVEGLWEIKPDFLP